MRREPSGQFPILRILVLSSVLILATACKKEPLPDSAGNAGAVQTTQPMEDPTSLHSPPGMKKTAAVPAQGIVSPAQVTLLNDSGAEVTLDTTAGDFAPFGVVSRSGDLDPSIHFGTCFCKCGEPCPDAAKPPYREITLSAGKSFSFDWSGSLTLFKKNKQAYGWCCEVVAPPVGKYTITACTKDKRCAQTTVSLPAESAIVVRMSAEAKAQQCEDVDMQVGPKVMQHFVRTHLDSVREGSGALCGLEPICVEANTLQSVQADARQQACSLFLVPRGNEVEVRAFLPLPQGPKKGETFSAFYDPAFTRLFRVDYSQ